MEEKPPVSFKTVEGDHDHQIVRWDLGANESGVPLPTHGDGIGYSRASFHVFGDFEGVEEVVIQGRIVAGEYETLSDKDGLLSFTRPDLRTTLDMVKEIRPVVVGGTEQTKITVAVFAAR